MMNWALLFSLFLSNPGDLIHQADQQIRDGLNQCGYDFVSGSDFRLPGDVINRRVDEVVVVSQDDAPLVPVVLEDWSIWENKLNLRYFTRQGHLLVSFNRDFDFNDFSATTLQGTLMQSHTFVTSGGRVTRYYIRSQEATASEFERYLSEDLIPSFTHYVCQ